MHKNYLFMHAFICKGSPIMKDFASIRNVYVANISCLPVIPSQQPCPTACERRLSPRSPVAVFSASSCH